MTAPTGIDLEAIRKRHEKMADWFEGTFKLDSPVISAHRDRAALLALAASQAEQIAGMRDALEPFAKEATRSTREDADMADSVQWLSFSDITYGDLRAVKAAYDATERKPTDG